MEFLTEIALNETPPRWLTLTGISGTGKTYLSKLVVDAYRAEIQTLNARRYIEYHGKNKRARIPSFKAVFAKWRIVSERLRNAQWQATQPLKDAHLLVLDDIGDSDESAMTSNKLYDLLDSRLGKWTIITSNKSIKDFSLEERRIASRMTRDNNQFVEFGVQVEDYGLRTRKARKSQ